MRAMPTASVLESLQLDSARVESLSEPGLSELIRFLEDEAAPRDTAQSNLPAVLAPSVLGPPGPRNA